MAITVSPTYASFRISNGAFRDLQSVPSSVDWYVMLIYDLSGYTVESFSTSMSVRGSCQYPDDISVQSQIEMHKVTIDSSSQVAYIGDYIGAQYDDWWIPANSSTTRTTNVSATLNTTFEENTGIGIVFMPALPDVVGGTVSANVTSMPRLTVEGTAGGGSGTDPGTGGGGGSTTPSAPRNPPVSATPSSPSGSSTVSPGKDTNFSWRISKYLDTTAYAGSQLQYRYGGNGRTYTLGNTQYDITTFTFSGGFSSNSIVQWRVRTGITAADGYWDLDGLLEEAGYDLTTLENEGYEWSGGVFYSKWSDWVSFQTGDYEYEPEPTYTANVSIITPSGGTKSGTETIAFAFEVHSQGYSGQYEAQYSVDDGLSWNSLTSGSHNSGSYEVHFNASGFPAGTVKWRARARANSDWSSWATASFTVTYDGYGQIVVSYGPINKGKRGDLPFLVEASLTMVGEAGEVVHLNEATFCWRSGESNNFAEIAMQPYTGVGGSEYTLTLAPNVLPYGLIQWYLKGKDTKDVETETEVYNTYILRSNIDSIALSPISTIENTENEITFKWAYISENEQKPNKVEIQFSEDGVSWGYPISVEFGQNE